MAFIKGTRAILVCHILNTYSIAPTQEQCDALADTPGALLTVPQSVYRAYRKMVGLDAASRVAPSESPSSRKPIKFPSFIKGADPCAERKPDLGTFN